MKLRFGLLQKAIHRSLIFVRLFTTRLSQNAQLHVGYAVRAVGSLMLIDCKSLLFNYLQDEPRTDAFLHTTATLVHSLSVEIPSNTPTIS